MKAPQFRKKHPVFSYESFSYRSSGGDFIMSFIFRLSPDIKFRPTLKIKGVGDRAKKISKELLENLVFHVGLAEIPSYWKAAISPEIIIKCGALDRKQISFWEDLLWNGLSEFCYVNKIDIHRSQFVKIISEGSKKYKALSGGAFKSRLLVPLGGGKDSIVTLELLKKQKKNIGVFVLNPRGFHKNIIKISGVKEKIFAERKIDKKLLELNRKGYLNGHTPFSSYIAFLSMLAASLFGYGRVFVSNEKSADEENLRWRGRKINHQYSKTYAFEKKFKAYAAKYLVHGVGHRSFLRKFYEIDIAKIFSGMPQYFGAFLSCNRGLREERWCGKCPKCFFAHLILYPYLREKELIKIFRKDFFYDKSLLPLAKSLLGIGTPKPFECVGTRNEIKKAFRLGISKAKKNSKTLPAILDKIEKEIT